jgi:hypothetical protein
MAVLSGSETARRAVRDRPAAGTLPLAAISGVALLAACLVSPSEATHGPVVCPFRLVTGLPCPGCGMTRGWVFLTHGRVGDAVSANPFALVTLPAAMLLVLLVGVALVRRRPLPDPRRVLRHPAAWLLLAGWMAFSVLRVGAVLTGHATT